MRKINRNVSPWLTIVVKDGPKKLQRSSKGWSKEAPAINDIGHDKIEEAGDDHTNSL